MGMRPSTEPTSSRTLKENWFSLTPNPPLAYGSSGSRGGSQAPASSMLECWLARFYAGLVQADTAIVSSFMQWTCLPWPLLALTIFLASLTWRSQSLMGGARWYRSLELSTPKTFILCPLISCFCVERHHCIKKLLRWDLRVVLIYAESVMQS